MAYVGKKLYSILQSKAQGGDKKVMALLNQLNEMPQEAAEAQINIIMKGEKKPIETTDEPSAKSSADPTADKARDLVDTGEFSDYDQAYNMLTKQGLRQKQTQNAFDQLPESFENDDILIQTIENAGFEVSKVDKDGVVVKINGNEVTIPIERAGEQIKLRKGIK